MGKNPVLVLPSNDVRQLDMMPRIQILEDLQFRKALPKSYKYFDKCLPFGAKLGKIKDYQKFMQAISRDMLKTTLTRDNKHFADYFKDKAKL